MEITNYGVRNAPLTPQAQLEQTSASGNQSAPSPTPNSSAYTPSAELTRLLNQVRAQPEVREDRVQAAAASLQQGTYNCQTSIAQTAQAMIQNGG
jgi:hypothetical protein